MKKIENYLEEYKKLENIKTDMELSRIMKVGRSKIYEAKKGYAKSIGRKKYIIIAKRLGIHPMEIIATIEAEVEKDEEMKKLWIELANEKAKKCSGLH